MLVDFRSDTVTRPSAEMRNAMFNAPLGDDVFGEDPTVLELEKFAAEMFGMEAAIYCPSGTMTNQIAIKAHTRPLEEVICDKLSHIQNYELAGHAFHSGLSIKLLTGDRGRLTVSDLEGVINPDLDWNPVSKLLVLENTCNKGGGSCYELSDLQEVCAEAKKLGLIRHLDGARLFNALVRKSYSAGEVGACFDSISICLSKGLGAPVGSLLLGEKGFIRDSRRIRKVFGGGMRQAGIIAAAGLFALKNNVDRLREDHECAADIAESLAKKSWVKKVVPVETNIVNVEINADLEGQALIEMWKNKGILAVEFAPQSIRLVTHLDITGDMIHYFKSVNNQI